MTYLINCYGNLEAEIKKLQISDSRTNLDENQLEIQLKQLSNYKQSIMSSIEKTNLKYCHMEDKSELGIMEVGGFYDQLFNFNFDMFCKVHFNFHSHQITIFTTLATNFVPFRIKNKNHKIMLSRFILRANAAMKYGSFRIDSNSGQLTLCFNSVFSYYQFRDLIDKPNKLIEYLEEQFLKSKYFYRIYIFKILYLVNQVGQNFMEDPQLLNVKIKTISIYYKQTEDVIVKIVPTMHLEYPFFYSDNAYTGTKQVTMDQAKRMNEAVKAMKIFKKPLPPNVTNIIKMIISTREANSQKVQDGFSEQVKKDFVTKIIQPSVKYSSGQVPHVYSEIHVVSSPPYWQMIDQGGFGVILKGTILFVFKQHVDQANNQPNHKPQPFNRQIVKKEDHDQESKKLNHQKNILMRLKQASSPFIAKFYYSEQPEYKNSLLIEYCFQKSLSLLRLRNSQFLSLASKLTYLKHLAQGIKFLKDHDICHLDIKPSNLLFSAGLVKITDFGEAHHPQVCPPNFRPGTSIPYAPPQSFGPGQIKFNNKLDIFSFGVVMYELLYQSYPFDYTRTKYELFKKAYYEKNYSSLIYQAPEKVLREGFSGINYLLKFMALKCLDEDERKRPCIEWIVITLQYCISQQLQLY